jgi:hypothetical protein
MNRRHVHLFFYFLIKHPVDSAHTSFTQLFNDLVPGGKSGSCG